MNPVKISSNENPRAASVLSVFGNHGLRYNFPPQASHIKNILHTVAKTVNLQERCRGAEPCVEQDVARWDIGSLRFLQELKHHLGCLLLGKFSLLAAIGTSVYFP